MSTSRKLVVKLDSYLRRSPKHRCAARKPTLTKAALDDPEAEAWPWQTYHAFHHWDGSHDSEENCHRPLHYSVTEYVCFCHWQSGNNYMQDTFCSQAHRARQPRAPRMHRAASPHHRNVSPAPLEEVLLKTLLFACQIHPLKFCEIFTLFFISQGTMPRKGSSNPALSLKASRHPLRAATP